MADWERTFWEELNVMKITTRKMAYMAMLVVLNIVLTRIASIRIAIGNVEATRIGFGGFPVILAGIAMGPAAGGLVGAMGDIIGYWINPMGAYMPHFTMTAALTGVIPGLVIKLFRTETPNFWQLFIAIALGQLITSVLLVPYFLYKLFGIPFTYKVVSALITQSFNIPIYTTFAKMIMKRVSFSPAP